MEDKSVTIMRIPLGDVRYKGISRNELAGIVKEIERRLEKVSKRRETVDTFKILMHALLDSAVEEYRRNIKERGLNYPSDDQ